MELTKSQRDWLEKRSERRTREVKQGIGSFKLNRQQCSEYLNINNMTFHAPFCTVVRVEGDYAVIKAIFFGSGFASHPVRSGRMPLDEVNVPPSKIILFAMRFWNFLSSLWNSLFHRKKGS